MTAKYSQGGEDGVEIQGRAARPLDGGQRSSSRWAWRGERDTRRSRFSGDELLGPESS